MIHLCIYAVATIAKDTEVTIAFDYEYNIWWVLHLAQELSTALLDWTSSSSPFLAFYILLRFLLIAFSGYSVQFCWHILQ